MDNEVMQEKAEIHEKMEETKNSIADKLEALEQKVAAPVENVSDAVTETIEAVKETVEAVKDQVEGTADAVKEAVHESVQSVRHWFDITHHVQQHPWVVMGVSVGAGFLLQSLLPRSTPAPKVEAAAPQPLVTNGHGSSHHARRRREHKKSWFDDFTPALSQVKSLAMGALFGSIKGLVTKSLTPEVGKVVGDIINKVAAKLGGDADSHNDEPSSSTTAKGKPDGSYTDTNPAEMGRPLGSARW